MSVEGQAAVTAGCEMGKDGSIEGGGRAEAVDEEER